MPAKRTANFLYLLLGLLVILVAAPIVQQFTQQSKSLVLHVAFSATLIIGIWSLVSDRRWFMFGIALTVADLVLTTGSVTTGSGIMVTAALLIQIAFFALSLVFALQSILFTSHMDLNRIVGAICVYLLLGLLLGTVNILIDTFVPGSFKGIDAAATTSREFALIYYTFVTMTTLGYGDITPTGGLARAIAYLAAIAGQFYIAVLVAMVVAQYINQANRAR